MHASALAVNRGYQGNYQHKPVDFGKTEQNKVDYGNRDYKKAKYERKCDHCSAKGHTKDACVFQAYWLS